MTTTLITGATRGLGRETARRLVEAGHTVFLGARSTDGRSVADELGAELLLIDVTDDASVNAAAARLTEHPGHIDVLINNAGIAGLQRPPGEADLDDMTRVFDTNVYGPMSKAALNMLTVQYAKAYPRWRVNSVTPGLTATEFTPTTNSGWSVEQGADIIVRMATIGSDGPTGTFSEAAGTVPW